MLTKVWSVVINKKIYILIHCLESDVFVGIGFLFRFQIFELV